MAVLTLVASSAPTVDASAASDILERCQAFYSTNDGVTSTSILDIDESVVPNDVLSVIASNGLAWQALGDTEKVGLLWAYGYVFTGTSDTSAGAGSSILSVYTDCSDQSIAMKDIAVSADEFTSANCTKNNCGTFYQATNSNCTSSIQDMMKCAVADSSTTLTTSSGSMWSSASLTSEIPYPQAFQHKSPIYMNGSPPSSSPSTTTVTASSTLTIVAIHMKGGSTTTACDKTGDTVIPCLRLADVDNSTRPFCRPPVNSTEVQAFLSALLEVADVESGSEDKSNSSGLVIGLVVGALILCLIGAGLYWYCRRQQDTPTSSGTATLGGLPTTFSFRKSAINGTTSNNRHQSWRSRFTFFDSNRTNDEENSSSIIIASSTEESDPTSQYPPMTSTRSSPSINALDEYCNESKVLADFVADPLIFTRRIEYDEITFLRILSKGAFGEVWLGQLETRHVAMKRLLPEKCRLTHCIEQFAGEIQLMCILQHPNIVSFVGVSWNRLENLCAVVEYMEAGDLEEVLKKNKTKFTWKDEKISIAMDVTEGLVYLHCLRPTVIHRDLKSKNVLLNRKNQAKLSDFGVSRKTAVNETLTSGVGTLLWTAPEIIEGKKYSEKADIYSLGVVLSELDTCEGPFAHIKNEDNERLPAMQIAHLARSGKIRVHFRDDCPPQLKELALACTQLDPDLRPTSMQVAYTLKSILAPALRQSSLASV